MICSTRKILTLKITALTSVQGNIISSLVVWTKSNIKSSANFESTQNHQSKPTQTSRSKRNSVPRNLSKN